MTALAAPAERRWALLRDPALVGAAGLGALALLRLRDPHAEGSYGFCPFLQLTGLPCPGCGGLRAVNDLTHGEVTAAMGSNVLAVGLLAVLAIAWMLWVVRRWRGRRDAMIALGLRSGLAVLTVFVAFGVLRNTPWGAALAP